MTVFNIVGYLLLLSRGNVISVYLKDDEGLFESSSGNVNRLHQAKKKKKSIMRDQDRDKLDKCTVKEIVIKGYTQCSSIIRSHKKISFVICWSAG